MDIIKPEPLHLGNRYYYTLTSYEPVSITVRVPRVTQADIDIALGQIAAEHEAARNGATGPSQVPDINDAWVKREFPNLKSVAELREALAHQLEQLNSQAAEESKGALCAAELAKRLGQSVPESEIDHVRALMQEQMASDLAREGMTVSDFMARAGFPQASINAMLDEQAKTAAQQDAAIDAFAQERKLKIDDAELPQYLGVPLEQAEQIIADAREHGQLDSLRLNALHMKALRIAVAEASCSYVQETAEEAEERTRQYQRIMASAAQKLGRGQTAEKGDEDDQKPTFKLVD